MRVSLSFITVSSSCKQAEDEAVLTLYVLLIVKSRTPGRRHHHARLETVITSGIKDKYFCYAPLSASLTKSVAKCCVQTALTSVLGSV